MYTFVEIALIFSNCTTTEECLRARRSFAVVAEDLSSKKIFYIRNRQRVREMEIKNLKIN
jgi:hypothetical protein